MDIDELKGKLWMWGPFIVVGLLIAGVIYFTVPMIIDAYRGDQQSDEYLFGTPYELTLSENLRRAYLNANGGEESLNALQSVRSRGVLETGGGRVPFLSIKKRPWQSLLTLRFPSYELSFVVDGDTVWQRVTVRGQEPVVTLKEGDEALGIRQLGAFFDPVMMVFLLEEGIIHGIKEGFWEEQPAVILDFENAELKLRSKAYIDPRTMHLLARVDDLADGSERTLLYSDYRKVGDLLEPFVTEAYVDGNFENRATVERSEHNIGTFPSFFHFPGATEQ